MERLSTGRNTLATSNIESDSLQWHPSHCGSTPLSRMLGNTPRHQTFPVAIREALGFYLGLKVFCCFTPPDLS
jgi:hypothetical protein